MAELFFEIWAETTGSAGPFMYLVNEQNDVVRRATMPLAVLVHSFTARSNFEAFRKKNEWAGFGLWRPEADWEEHFFDEKEAESQRDYLRERRP
jgi:hypothetical protein